MKTKKCGPYAEIVDGKARLSETGKAKLEEFLARYENEPFRLFFHAYPKLWNLACRVSTSEEVHAACMEGCVRAFIYLDESKAKDTTYCALVMKHTVQKNILRFKKDTIQKRWRYFAVDDNTVSINQKREDGSNFDIDAVAPDDGATSGIERSEYLISILRNGMDNLTDRQRYCLLRYYSGTVSSNDIAAELGVSRSAVNQSVKLGLRHLKAFVESKSYSL